MGNLADRVEQVLRETGLNGSELARKASVTKGVVSQWRSGQIAVMGYKAASEIEAQLGYRKDWLINGDEPPKAKLDAESMRIAEQYQRMSQEQRIKFSVLLSLVTPPASDATVEAKMPVSKTLKTK